MSRRGTIWRTQTTAVMCVYFMHYHGYEPKTILNVGVSSGFEIGVWRWLYPHVPIVGIDPRRKLRGQHKDIRYVQVAASNHDGIESYCMACHSIRCKQTDEHAPYLQQVPAVLLDDIARDLEPPYFIWMDVDGGELLALQGGQKTLEQTKWLNVEIIDWEPGDGQATEDWLVSRGFKRFWKDRNTHDRLYCRNGDLPAQTLSEVASGTSA